MKINLLFANAKTVGTLKVKYGTLVSNATFGPCAKTTVEIKDENVDIGAFPTIVTVLAGKNSFSFNLRDVASKNPVFVPDSGAAVLPDDDRRSYTELKNEIASKRLCSDFDRMNSEPEESFENACRDNRNKPSPVWLGLGRDMRIFRIGPQEAYGFWGWVTPRYHSKPVLITLGKEEQPYQLCFELGPGSHCSPKITNRLEAGVLPIIHSIQDEDAIQYHVTAFATLEKGPLKKENVRGSEWHSAQMHTGYSMMAEQERLDAASVFERENEKCDNQVVCIIHIEALNVSETPAYAWFKAAHHGGAHFCNRFSFMELDAGMTGTGIAKDTRVCAVNRINGQAAKNAETAILVQPGEKAVFEIIMPHIPIQRERAAKLLALDYTAHFEACREFWLDKLDNAAKFSIPEKAIDERIRAGLLHLDINTLGHTQEGPLLATVGWYGPIGSESAPMIQYYDSVGLHDTAARCCEFFLERQRADGFIQTYGGYESETGPLLWCVGEHYFYTRDLKWLKRMTPRLVKSCDYLLEWRNKNKLEKFRDQGCYGLMAGKVADIDEYLHAFFLNAGSHIGLKRMAEVLKHTKPEYAKMLRKEVELYRQDLCNALEYVKSNAPAIPFRDGTWGPSFPGKTEYAGHQAYHADGGVFFSHGAIASTCTGPLYLAISEVLDVNDPLVTMMLKANQHPHTRKNAALSQPYYCRHDYAHLMRGEVKLFLKTFYNQMTAMQDRECYTFWEHYFGASEQKTHEEAWFLMQTRWMLYVESRERLFLFRAIPRKWLKAGQRIAIEGAKSRFGTLNVSAVSKGHTITCEFEVERKVGEVCIRLPHAGGKKAVSCRGGRYDPQTETVAVKAQKGKVILEF